MPHPAAAPGTGGNIWGHSYHITHHATLMPRVVFNPDFTISVDDGRIICMIHPLPFNSEARHLDLWV